MPSDAPEAKRAAVQRCGDSAHIYTCEPTQQSREDTCQSVQRATGGRVVHPSEDPRVIAGQGTLALELYAQVKEMIEQQRQQEGHASGGDDVKADSDLVLDAVFVPIGGGGMISGCAVALRGLDPNIKIFAAEPLTANDAWRSLQAGERLVHEAPPQTSADGLKTCLGENTWPLVRDFVEQVVCVTEIEISAALRLVYERLKLVIEPSAAVGVAAVLLASRGQEVLRALAQARGAGKARPLRVGVVLCGGNVNVSQLTGLMAAGASLFQQRSSEGITRDGHPSPLPEESAEQ
jgi:threonine dehydratase